MERFVLKNQIAHLIRHKLLMILELMRNVIGIGFCRTRIFSDSNQDIRNTNSHEGCVAYKATTAYTNLVPLVFLNRFILHTNLILESSKELMEFVSGTSLHKHAGWCDAWLIVELTS